MKINKPAIVLASALAMTTACDDNKDVTNYPGMATKDAGNKTTSTTSTSNSDEVQYPHGNGVVTKGAGNETATEKKAAAFLQSDSKAKYRCHDYISHPMLGKILREQVDSTRTRVKAMTKCEVISDVKEECTEDVLFNKHGDPFMNIAC